MRKPRPGLVELQKLAVSYTHDYLSKYAISLPADLDEQQFSEIMDAIVKAIVSAWAAGYEQGTQR